MKYFPIESPVFGHHHQLDEDFIIKIESEVIIDCTESVLTDSVSNSDDIRATMSLCQTSNQNQFNCLIDNSCSNDDNNSKTDENDIIDYNDNDDIDIKPVIGESTVGRRCSSPTHPAFMRRTSSFESSGYVGSSYTSSETASIKSDTGSSCEKSETESICATNGVNGASSKDSSNGAIDNTPYFCKWTNCDWPGNKDDLVDHIREIHVELQPYQQQKHNWEIKSNGGQLSSMAIDRKICTDSSSNNNKLVNSKKFGDSSNIGSQCKKSESQQYVCLWEGCKVYGKSSLSRNWLERHALLHSGPRPFKCIVEGCDARFKTQSALERHVNSHFKPNVADLSCSNSTNNFFEPSTSTTANGILTPSNYSSGDNSNHCSNGVNGMSPFELHLQQSSHATMIRVKSVNDSNQLMNGSHANANPSFNHSNATPNKILKRKKSQTKLKRKCIIVKCSEDFFDECVMEQVRYGLIQLNAQTGLDMSTQTAITFHSKVIARRKNDESGEINVLLKWEPNDILPDVWVTEPEVSALKSKSIPISLLPQECLAQLTELSGEEIKPKIKQRRK